MFRFVNEWHIEGKLKWTPYCIAYSYKQRYEKGKTLDEISGGVHQKKPFIKQYIDAISKMHRYSRHGKETEFSYFLELVKFEKKQIILKFVRQKNLNLNGKILNKNMYILLLMIKNLKLQTFVTFSIQLWNDKGDKHLL